MGYRKNFVWTKNEFALAMVNKTSVFEQLKFDYILITHFSKAIYAMIVLPYNMANEEHPLICTKQGTIYEHVPTAYVS